MERSAALPTAPLELLEIAVVYTYRDPNILYIQ